MDSEIACIVSRILASEQRAREAEERAAAAEARAVAAEARVVVVEDQVEMIAEIAQSSESDIEFLHERLQAIHALAGDINSHGNGPWLNDPANISTAGVIMNIVSGALDGRPGRTRLTNDDGEPL